MAFTTDLTIDESTVEEQEVVTFLPVIRWMYGNSELADNDVKTVKARGGFFISESTIPGNEDEKGEYISALLENGWSKLSYKAKNGETVDGFAAEDAQLAILHKPRKCWESYDDDGNRTGRYPFNWDVYNAEKDKHPKMSTRVQLLVVIKGLENLSPALVTLSGTAQFSFSGIKKERGIIQDYSDFLRTIERQIGARLPLRRFWVHFCAERDKKGEPVFKSVGSGTNSTLLCTMSSKLPNMVTATDKEVVKYRDTYAVEGKDEDGRHLVTGRFLDLWREYEQWPSEWDSMDGAALKQIFEDETSDNSDGGATNIANPNETSDLIAEAGI